jgi:hypothetical protein
VPAGSPEERVGCTLFREVEDRMRDAIAYVNKVDELLLELVAAGRDFKNRGHCGMSVVNRFLVEEGMWSE